MSASVKCWLQIRIEFVISPRVTICTISQPPLGIKRCTRIAIITPNIQYDTGFDARRCQLPRPEARLAISSGVSEAPGSSVGRIPIVSPSLPEPETSAPDRAELCAALGFEDAPPRPVSRPVDPSESEPEGVGLWGFSLTVLSFDRFYSQCI